MNNRNSLQLKAYTSQIYDDAITIMIVTFLLLFLAPTCRPKHSMCECHRTISSCAHWM